MLSDVYFPRINGVSTSIQTFAGAFVDQGHTVTLIAPNYPERYQPGFEVIRIPSMRLPFDPEDRLMSLRAVKRLLPRLREGGIDLVHVQTPFVAHYAGVFLSRALGLPLVVSYHTFFEAYFEKYLPRVPRSWLRGVARRYSRKQCNQADAVISPSRQMREKLLEYGVDRPVVVIPTGLPEGSFQRATPNDFRSRHGLAEDVYLLLYVGRVAYEKNIEMLMEMFGHVHEQVDRAVLLIAGEGPALPALQERARQMGRSGQIRFVGYLDRATELLACYQASDLFVFASQTETQGLVLLEAMASGLPVVSTAGMGTLDVLVEGEGCLIAPPDPVAFAQRVVALHADSDRRTELSRRGRDYARRWGGEAKAGEMLAFYRQLTAAAPSAGPADAPVTVDVAAERVEAREP